MLRRNVLRHMMPTSNVSNANIIYFLFILYSTVIFLPPRCRGRKHHGQTRACKMKNDLCSIVLVRCGIIPVALPWSASCTSVDTKMEIRNK